MANRQLNLREVRTITPLEGPYVEFCGKKLLDFSSSDYLGLADHPDVRKNSIRYILKYGVGSSAEHWLPQQQLERKLAHFIGMETALLFSSYQEVLASFSGDLLADASLRHPSAPAFGSLDELKTLLGKKKNQTIVASSHNFALRDLVKIAKSHGAMLCMDDTETFGIQGTKGFGLSAHQKDVDFVIGSCVKGGGCNLSYIACAENHRSLFIQQWTIPAAILGALDAVLNFLPDMDSDRETVAKHTAWLAQQLGTPPTLLPTLSVQFPTELEAQEAVDELLAAEIFVARPEKAVLSFTMTALHTPDDLDQLAIVLKKLSTTVLALATQSPTLTPPK